MAKRNIKYAIYALAAIVLLSLLIYPNAYLTGRQTTISQTAFIGQQPEQPQPELIQSNTCYELQWWKCIWTVNCWWEIDNRECVIWNETKEIYP